MYVAGCKSLLFAVLEGHAALNARLEDPHAED
jgi:hypothetical protein